MGVSELNRARVKIRWARVHAEEERYISENSHATAPLKARLNAYLCGDGSVYWRNEKGTSKIHAEIRFYPDHASLVDSFAQAFLAVYGKQINAVKLKNHFLLSITSMVIVKDLLIDTSFSSTLWRVPNWIKNDEQCTIEWLRAFFDAEAYVGSRRICVQSVNLAGLQDVAEMLTRFNLTYKQYSYSRPNKNWNTNYHLVIGRLRDRKQFLKRIGFNHKEKMRKLTADVA